MFCTKCGATLQEGSQFCTKCGAPVSAPAPASVSTPIGENRTAGEAAPAATVKRASAPAPAAVSPSPAAAPISPRASKKRLGGGAIALIIAAVALILAAVVLAVLFLFPRGGGSAPSAEPVEGEDLFNTAEPDLSGTGEVLTAPVLMDGVYYCAQEPGSTLELRQEGDQLSIYKTYYTSVDVSTLIPTPAGASFTINYGGRLIEFYYSVSGRSVTVSEAGESSIFTTDGDRGWVVDAVQDVQDPFTDPNGYILPSDSRYLTAEDLADFDLSQLQLARNEIFARYGYSFEDAKYQDYFRSKTWYFENPSANATAYSRMNQYEQENISIIQAREAELKG